MQSILSFRVVVGKLDISQFVDKIRIYQQINNLASAEFLLLNAPSLPAEVDYTALVRIFVKIEEGLAATNVAVDVQDDVSQQLENEMLRFTGTVSHSDLRSGE